MALESEFREMLGEMLEAMIVLDSAELDVLESELMCEISLDTELVLT